jgi:hypothetical protein
MLDGPSYRAALSRRVYEKPSGGIS